MLQVERTSRHSPKESKEVATSYQRSQKRAGRLHVQRRFRRVLQQISPHNVQLKSRHEFRRLTPVTLIQYHLRRHLRHLHHFEFSRKLYHFFLALLCHHPCYQIRTQLNSHQLAPAILLFSRQLKHRSPLHSLIQTCLHLRRRALACRHRNPRL